MMESAGEEALIDEEFLEAYKQLSSKIAKKQFLFVRRGTFEEANVELLKWQDVLRRQGNDPYAAFCLLAVARSQHALDNPPKEAACYLDAGQIFWEEQLAVQNTKALHLEDNTTQAIHCYLCAIDIYTKQRKPALAASLFYELATILQKLHLYLESAQYFMEAADLQERWSVMSAIISCTHASRCHIRQRDFLSAVACTKRIIKLAGKGADPQDLDDVRIKERPLPGEAETFAKILQETLPYPMASFYTQSILEARVTLFLLYLLQRLFEKAISSLRHFKAKTETHMGKCWFDDIEEFYLSEPTLYSSFSSLVAIFKDRDGGVVEEVKQELAGSLNSLQWELLNLIVQEILTPIS